MHTDVQHAYKRFISRGIGKMDPNRLDGVMHGKHFAYRDLRKFEFCVVVFPISIQRKHLIFPDGWELEIMWPSDFWAIPSDLQHMQLFKYTMPVELNMARGKNKKRLISPGT